MAVARQASKFPAILCFFCHDKLARCPSSYLEGVNRIQHVYASRDTPNHLFLHLLSRWGNWDMEKSNAYRMLRKWLTNTPQHQRQAGVTWPTPGLSPLYKLAAAAAKSLQSCPTLCDPIDGSPPGSAVPRILQARTLEWVAISFSNAWKWKVKVKPLSPVWL